MAKQTEITVEIRNFEGYKGRKDVEHNSWFRCSNRLLEDPDFFEFSAEEILVWVYILSLSSQKNSPRVTIKFAHAERVCRLKKSIVESAILKLSGNQIDPVDVTLTSRGRYADDTQTCATDRQTDITDKQTNSVNPPLAAYSADDLKNLWNIECDQFAKVARFTDARKASARIQLAKYPDIAHWREVLERWKRSEFCTTKWRPTFDDWLNEGKRIKTLEGRYDNRASAARDPFAELRAKYGEQETA